VTTETFRDGVSIGGPLSHYLPKPATTQCQPLLRTGMGELGAESGDLTISGSRLTVQ